MLVSFFRRRLERRISCSTTPPSARNGSIAFSVRAQVSFRCKPQAVCKQSVCHQSKNTLGRGIQCLAFGFGAHCRLWDSRRRSTVLSRCFCRIRCHPGVIRARRCIRICSMASVATMVPGRDIRMLRLLSPPTVCWLAW